MVRLVWDGTGPRLAPWSRAGTYGAAPVAVCTRRFHHHDAPHPRCRCGLWACPDTARLFEATGAAPGAALAQVRLGGTVVEHVLPDGTVGGWRASHLVFDSLALSSTCWCGAPAEVLCAPEGPAPFGPPPLTAWCTLCAATRPVVSCLSPLEASVALSVPVALTCEDPKVRFHLEHRHLLEALWRSPRWF